MCYSAQVSADYKKFVRAWGAVMSIKDYHKLYWERSNRVSKLKIPKAMDHSFADPTSPEEREIADLITAYNRAHAMELEAELFRQRTRLVAAERSLATKMDNKKALNDKRVAPGKIAWCEKKLADLRRSEATDADSRIFPGWVAPVMVFENGQRVVKPMRYKCRVGGTPAAFDERYPGTYNARRESLGPKGFWRSLWGVHHGILIVNAFYENVSQHALEGRELLPGEHEQNVVLEFRPQPMQDMLVACLWSRWVSPDGAEDLLSFAALTDVPPAEVAAAGHDRCIIPIKADHVDEWLNPKPGDFDTLNAILDDRPRPYYEHRRAA